MLYLPCYEERYHKEQYKECDFIVFDKFGERRIMQVSYSISDMLTRQREIEGLSEACRRHKADEGYILTLSEEEEIKGKDITIHVIPAYKFLLA